MKGYTLKLVTAATAQPVTAAEAQVYARIEDFAGATPNSDSDLIDNLIEQGVDEIEQRGLALVAQTWDLILWTFPDVIVLPKNPIRSLTSITYLDSDGASQTLATDQYALDDNACPAVIRPAYGVSWPATRYVYNGVTVRFVAGYAPTATPTDIPERLRQFVKEYVKARYWDGEVPDHAYGLLDPYSVYY